MTRQPVGDRPSADNAEALHSELVAYVAQRRRLVRAQRVRGPGARAAYVLVDGTEAWVATTDHETVTAEGTLPVTDLLERLGGQPTFDDLEAVVAG